MTLGITDGSVNVGLMNYGDDNLIARTGAYGANVGVKGSTGTYNTGKTLGITTDVNKSGLIATFSGLALGTVTSKKLGNFYIRY